MVLVLSIHANVANVPRNDTVAGQALLTSFDPIERAQLVIVSLELLLLNRCTEGIRRPSDPPPPACIHFVSVRVSR